MAYSQYVQQNTPTNPYSQLVSNLSQATKDGLYPTVQPNLADTGQIGDITKAPIIYGQSEPDRSQVYSQNTNSPVEIPPGKQEQSQPQNSENNVNKPLISLVHYDSDTEDEAATENEATEDQSSNMVYKLPPDEMKLIIDKMASYVSKNGRDFEAIVRSKGDPRFEFLQEEHEYHSYYKFKIVECGEESVGVKEEQKSIQNGVQPMQQQQVLKESQVQQHIKPKDKKIISKF